MKFIAIYAPTIYTAPCVMLLMRPASITMESGRRLGPGNLEFLGPVKWHRADRRVPFEAQLEIFSWIAELSTNQHSYRL
jgi:hypothetical protein